MIKYRNIASNYEAPKNKKENSSTSKAVDIKNPDMDIKLDYAQDFKVYRMNDVRE